MNRKILMILTVLAVPSLALAVMAQHEHGGHDLQSEHAEHAGHTEHAGHGGHALHIGHGDARGHLGADLHRMPSREELEEMGLDTDQIDRLERMHEELAEKAIDLKADEAKAELALHREMADDEARESDLLAAVDRLYEVKADLIKLDVGGLARAKRIVGPELFDELHADGGHGGH